MRRMDHAKPLHIFKPGRHTAMSGASLEFSSSDLAKSAAAYDPARHEAPIVVGHPRLDAPAYGWVSRLTAGEGGLEATPHQVNTEFADMVNAGAFKKISASFFSPDAPGNPVPGVYYLRHVGFLGAQPPAVKGLRNPQFAEGDEGIVEFADWDDRNNAGLWRSLRDWLLAKFGQDEADRAVPSWNVEALQEAAAQPDPEESVLPTPSFSEGTAVTPEQKAALEAENAALKARLADSEARDKAAKAKAMHAEHASFCEALVNAGQLTPGMAPVIVATLDAVTAGAPVEFGEGEGKQPLASALMDQLKAAPKLLEFGETSRDTGTVVSGVVNFAAPQGYAVDPAALALHAKVAAYQKTHQVSFDAALAACQ